MKMKSITPVLSCILALGLVTSLFAGIIRPEQPGEIDEEKLLIEAYSAVQLQLLEKLPYKIKGNMFSRRLIIPDPQYRAEFTKIPNPSRHMAFTLTRQSREEKKATTIATGYYDPATQKVYLRTAKEKVFVMAEKHPLVLGTTQE